MSKDCFSIDFMECPFCGDDYCTACEKSVEGEKPYKCVKDEESKDDKS